MFDINAKNARRTISEINERCKRRHTSTSTVTLVHHKEIPLVLAALEEYASNREAAINDERMAPKDGG